MSLTELKISTTEFKYVIMLAQEPRVIILSSLAEKKTGTGKEVSRGLLVRKSHAVPAEN